MNIAKENLLNAVRFVTVMPVSVPCYHVEEGPPLLGEIDLDQSIQSTEVRKMGSRTLFYIKIKCQDIGLSYVKWIVKVRGE